MVFCWTFEPLSLSTIVDGALRSNTWPGRGCLSSWSTQTLLCRDVCIVHTILPSTQSQQFSWTSVFSGFGPSVNNMIQDDILKLRIILKSHCLFIFSFTKGHGRNYFQISESGIILNHWFVFNHTLWLESIFYPPFCVVCQVTCRHICISLPENAPDVTADL